MNIFPKREQVTKTPGAQVNSIQKQEKMPRGNLIFALPQVLLAFLGTACFEMT